MTAPAGPPNVASLEQRIAALESALRAQGSERPPTSPDEVPGHAPWTCDACNLLLGYFDPATRDLRRRYRDDVTYINLSAPESKVVVPCRRCAYVNVLTGAHVANLAPPVVP